jgi:hypothetical protein
MVVVLDVIVFIGDADSPNAPGFKGLLRVVARVFLYTPDDETGMWIVEPD